ncbi:unnamed protein product [Rotaria sp. Silwood1]|nr:unnamed protein product [Rotaria sp. Silwood1]CAF0999048.1 unnamed protein product [Rotaria sp. Silwood1]CAF3421853.1 unnamed protein product [Rotaria sp. Silwood1]CAF4539793.1 unnamed protein product [Rotaria sp. Silwood1]
MAASATTHKSAGYKQPIKSGLSLVWLDDSAGQDPNIQEIFRSLFEQVFIFTDSIACLELVESADTEQPCILLLVSGKYGQMLVHDRFQPLHQVKDIYVYCFDVAKHNQWAQHCDKVRCVDSDFGKILKHMQHSVQKATKQRQQQQPTDDQQEQEEMQEEPATEEPERFLDDNNLYDQLALDILLQNSNQDDGIEDFKNYCRTHVENNNEELADEQQKSFKPNIPIKEWYKQDLVFVNLNSTDFIQLWTLRWFIRLFYRQLTNDYKHYIEKTTNIIASYGTWLTKDELDAMKHRIGESIIFTEFLLAYTTRGKALSSIQDKKTEQNKHKVIFEINANKSNHHTVPYTGIQDDTVLFWFGSRHRILKIEYVENQGDNKESYWLIGVNLGSTLNRQQSIETLYEYYRKKLIELNDVHYALGRILMYKGLYYQAEKWLQTNNHYEDLAELAIRQSQCERANQYLQHLPENSNDANLLRAYVNLLSSNDNIAKGRTILMKIGTDATDKIIRARVNIGLGFINLAVAQQNDQTLDYFTLGSETLCNSLPDIHPDIAKSYLGIGYAYFAQKKIKDAEKYFQMALTIQKQSLPYLHPDVAKTRSGIAHCLSVQKQTMQQALQELQYAYNILMHTFPREYKTHPEILLTKIDIDRLRKGKELYVRNTLLDYI